jgi:hypothetical protein
MSRVLVLVLAWLLLSLPLALLLGKTLRHGRTAVVDFDRFDPAPDVRSGPRRAGRRETGTPAAPTPGGDLKSQGPFEPRLALVDPGAGRATSTRAPSPDGIG